MNQMCAGHHTFPAVQPQGFNPGGRQTIKKVNSGLFTLNNKSFSHHHKKLDNRPYRGTGTTGTYLHMLRIVVKAEYKSNFCMKYEDNIFTFIMDYFTQGLQSYLKMGKLQLTQFIT